MKPTTWLYNIKLIGMFSKYHKNCDNKPWAYICLKGFFAGLIFGGACYWREFCVSKLVGLDNKNSSKDNKNSLKQVKTANPNSPWAFIWEGLPGIIGRIFASEFWGAYFREGLLLLLLFFFFFFFFWGGGGGLIIGILWYIIIFTPISASLNLNIPSPANHPLMLSFLFSVVF